MRGEEGGAGEDGGGGAHGHRMTMRVLCRATATVMGSGRWTRPLCEGVLQRKGQGEVRQGL